MERKNKLFNNGWCFAIMNGRLAEIYFQKKHGIYGYCYIDREKYSKKEQKMINTDIRHYKFTYRKGFYFDKLNGIKQKAPNMRKVFPDYYKYKKMKPSSLKELFKK